MDAGQEPRGATALAGYTTPWHVLIGADSVPAHHGADLLIKGREIYRCFIAKADHERVVNLLKHFVEQDKIKKEELAPFGPPPPDNPFDPNKAPVRIPRIPRNPLIR